MDVGAAVQFDGLAWEQVVPGARQKVQIVGEQRVRLLELDEGFVEEDWCHNVHLGMVLEGRMTLALPSGAVEVQAGDGLALTGGPAHRHKASVPEGGHVLLFLVEPLP